MIAGCRSFLPLALLVLTFVPLSSAHDIFATHNHVEFMSQMARAAIRNDKYTQEDKFRQLEEILPTPNQFRTASGAPGPGYWQQQADYRINVELDEANNRIIGQETVTYHNNSPDTLKYLWLQLDANLFTPDAPGSLARDAGAPPTTFRGMNRILKPLEFDGGVKLGSVKDRNGRDLPYTIVQTMMRIDLPRPMKPKTTYTFSIEWEYEINDAKYLPGRTGYETFDDGNRIYAIAQWYPRMAAYTDTNGWQHKQFLGNGEFTLEFGNFEVHITVPDDHVVASTGELLNAREVMTPVQRERWEEAKASDTPVFIVTPEEAKANEDSTPGGTKTWKFKAENVRDFAFASSRKFIWDAVEHSSGSNDVMVMSFYPNEGEPLWSKYSTHAAVHTIDVYSRFSFDYPYPTAISVMGVIGGGMEYPMICFNGPRPEADGTYSHQQKIRLIAIVIHEIGHNYIPMIINPDERQWTWMDEGLNSFLQYLAEQEWEKEFPSWWGEPSDIVPYMRSQNQVPIMTNSESILQFGNNAYAKPATALNVLRETILGRELFDHAFREFCQRWMFKRPQPADLFRSLEDASGIDLDWFWYGWFYTTDHVDLALTDVHLYSLDKGDPYVDKGKSREERDNAPKPISDIRNADLPKYVDRFPELEDFYTTYDHLDVRDDEVEAYTKKLESLDDDEKAILETNYNYYKLDFENIGGLVMPIILRFQYEDGTSEDVRIPAEIWRRDHETVSTMHITTKTIESVEMDPHLETADVDLTNNVFPTEIQPHRFNLRKSGDSSENPMQRAKRLADEKEKIEAEEHDEEESHDEDE